MEHKPGFMKDRGIQKLAELQPDAFKKFLEFEQAVFKPGKLSTKFKELIAVAAAQVAQCDACIGYHTGRALEEGATEEEIAEASMVAMELLAGSLLGHFGSCARAMQQHAAVAGKAAE